MPIDAGNVFKLEWKDLVTSILLVSLSLQLTPFCIIIGSHGIFPRTRLDSWALWSPLCPSGPMATFLIIAFWLTGTIGPWPVGSWYSISASGIVE